MRMSWAKQCSLRWPGWWIDLIYRAVVSIVLGEKGRTNFGSEGESKCTPWVGGKEVEVSENPGDSKGTRCPEFTSSPAVEK